MKGLLKHLNGSTLSEVPQGLAVQHSAAPIKWRAASQSHQQLKSEDEIFASEHDTFKREDDAFKSEDGTFKSEDGTFKSEDDTL